MKFRPVKLGGEDLVGLREDARTAGVQPLQFRATAATTHWVERTYVEAMGKDGEPTRVETHEVTFRSQASEYEGLRDWLESGGWFVWAPTQLKRHYTLKYNCGDDKTKDIALALSRSRELRGCRMRIEESVGAGGRHNTGCGADRRSAGCALAQPGGGGAGGSDALMVAIECGGYGRAVQT